VGAVLLATLLGSLGMVQAGPASAGPAIPTMPKLSPVDYTPRVVDDSVVTEAGVRELIQIGSTMYAGGHFHSVLNAARTSTYTRTNLVAFSATSGALTSWAPSVNGAVYAMEASADGRYLYVGGDFTTFAGVSVNHLVKYDLVNLRVDTTFRFAPAASGRVSDLQLVGGRLFAAGNFSGGIVAIDPGTGVATTYLDGVKASGGEAGYTTRVYRFSVNPAGTKAVLVGSFTGIGGRLRHQAAMINLGPSAATVSSWYSSRWSEKCDATLRWYTRDVDWTPTGDGFVIVTTGGSSPGTDELCDSVSRWAPVDAPNQQPVWVNLSGGDTFHSVAVTDRAVFVSGHFRWLDNPLGHNTKEAGAVDRVGIAAIDPIAGTAMSWNPGKSVEGGLGGFDLYFTSQGLWVGHFERYLGRNNAGTGGELHEGLGLLPF
jgi:hypothetical protein